MKMRPFFSSAYSACLYEDPLKELIHKFKYNNRRSLSKVFTDLLLDFIEDNPDIIDGVEMITFVPLYKDREFDRAFNQSELLASAAGKALRIPVKSCLEKTLKTRNQNQLSRQERLVNVKDAFSLKRGMEDIVKGLDMLIMDDVMTTGATLNDSSRALISAGAKRVRCLTLARGN
jgi:ComF family protein